MAMVPQIVMRVMALTIFEPPVLAAVAPSNIKERIVKPYSQYSIPLSGANKMTRSGKTPPTENAAPEAKAA